MSVERCGEDACWLLPGDTGAEHCLALDDWPGPGSCRYWFCSSEQATLPPWASVSPKNGLWTTRLLGPLLGEMVRTGVPGHHPRPRVGVLGARPAPLHFQELPGCASHLHQPHHGALNVAYEARGIYSFVAITGVMPRGKQVGWGWGPMRARRSRPFCHPALPCLVGRHCCREEALPGKPP